LTLAQFLNLHKSLRLLLRDATDEACGELLRSRIFDAHIDRAAGASECIICLERTADVILPCVHTFCMVCIERWKGIGKSWCPLCRQPLHPDGNDVWVTPDSPAGDELRNYLLSLTESSSTSDVR
uniref:RING-type domain-containing protein n=1 Tax=Gongylonema pulchrum TaxID=637853 RepID=A0A183F0Q9_9BILA